jgi:hypothetical protein
LEETENAAKDITGEKTLRNLDLVRHVDEWQKGKEAVGAR